MKKRGKSQTSFISNSLDGISMPEGDTKVYFKHWLLNFKEPLSIFSANKDVFSTLERESTANPQILGALKR